MNQKENHMITEMHEEIRKWHKETNNAISQISKSTSKPSLKDPEKPKSDEGLIKLLENNERLSNSVLNEVKNIRAQIMAPQKTQEKPNEKIYIFNFTNDRYIYTLGLLFILLLLSICVNSWQYKKYRIKSKVAIARGK